MKSYLESMKRDGSVLPTLDFTVSVPFAAQTTVQLTSWKVSCDVRWCPSWEPVWTNTQTENKFTCKGTRLQQM